MTKRKSVRVDMFPHTKQPFATIVLTPNKPDLDNVNNQFIECRNVWATDTTTSVETGQTTIEGTNSFGTLLSEDIQDQQNEDAESNSGGYNVTGLKIENGIATIEYSTLEKAVLVVALYSEDGIQLLLSSNTIVEPEGTEASIELEGEIPEYFMASAYLLDTYDYSPLCESYDTPMYTKEMQELLASTTDDYDADKVLNLDNSVHYLKYVHCLKRNFR